MEHERNNSNEQESRGAANSQYHLVIFFRLILLVLLFFKLGLRILVCEVDIGLRLLVWRGRKEASVVAERQM